jgi:rhodanese-related sulfurtransferase
MNTKQFIKSTSFNYFLLGFLLLLIAGGLVLLPKYEQHEGIKPEILLNNVISPERYISTDNLSNIIINQDPSYLLIDVRDSIQYEKYTLPNAINIPLEKLLDEDSELYLNQNSYNVVLFSNDDFYANEAWIICNRLNYKNLRVLKGGLNLWFNTIINPPKPTEFMDNNAFILYDTRKAASMYFGVAYPEQVKKSKVEVKKPEPKTVIPIIKKKKMPVEGGC